MSFYFLLDASALAKRYCPEAGSDLMALLFTPSQSSPVYLLLPQLAVGETLSVLNRKRNDGRIPETTFRRGVASLLKDTTHFRVVPINAGIVDQSLRLIVRHNINSTDAIYLQMARSTRAELRLAGDDLVFLSADTQLMAAASAEALNVFNPETDTEMTLRQWLPPAG